MLIRGVNFQYRFIKIVFKQLLHTTISVGIEYTVYKEAPLLNVLTLKKEKKELVLDSTQQYDNFESLKETLTKLVPVFLIINNEHILSKKIEGTLETEKAIVNAFPNLKIDNFYCEVLQGQTSTFVSICRKEYIDAIIDDYQKDNYDIIGFSLGNLIASQLCGVVKETTLQTSTSNISFDDKTITEITNSDEVYSGTYDINGLQITPNDILPLAGILSYYTGQKKTLSNFDTITNNLYNDFKQKRIFDVGLKVGLATIFVLLLVSFLFFSNYTSNIDQITAELEVNKTHKNTLLKLTDKVQRKEQLVANFSLASSKVSWYLDQVGMSIPNSVLLSGIEFQPVLINIKKEEQINLQESTIVIKGKSGNNNDFLKWINELEQLTWIDKVEIQGYGTGKKTINEFELLIEIRQ